MGQSGKKYMYGLVMTVICIFAVAGFRYQNQKEQEGYLIPQKNIYQIGILQDRRTPDQDRMTEGILAGLKAQGYTEGKKISIHRSEAGSSPDMMEKLAVRMEDGSEDLLIAVGDKAARAAAAAKGSTPIVASGAADISQLREDSGKSYITGMNDVPSVTGQLDMASKLVSVRRLGILYNPSDPASASQLQRLRNAASRRGVQLYEVALTSSGEAADKTRLFSGHADAVYLSADESVVSALPDILKITDQLGLPVIGQDENMVRRGALAAVTVDYYRMGFQAGQMAGWLLGGKTVPNDIDPAEQREFDMVVNMAEAKKLHIRIPNDIWQKARKLYLYEGQSPRP
jgi:putative ABC transport system substrate-binding protein